MIDRERGLWREQFGNVAIIRGSATPRVAGGVGGGEVANELRDIGIHRMNSHSTAIAALGPRQMRWTLFRRPKHVLIIATVILLLRKDTGALDLVLDALGKRVSLIFSRTLSVASDFSLLLSFIQIL